jgi:tRNA threonylcarbamoyladenosine biosynthesis protein TsaB
VALVDGDTLCGVLTSGQLNDHAANLTVLANSLLEQNGLTMKDMDAIAVSMGPGSYTGLRIGVSVAKGYCYAMDIPLIAINTLEIMAAGVAARFSGNTILCPMIDARRMEVYTALYTADLIKIKETEAIILDDQSFANELEKQEMVFFGNGAEKMAGFIENLPNAMILYEYKISAAHMVQAAIHRFNTSQFEDVAYFEPFYLKDFVAGAPRVKGL